MVTSMFIHNDLSEIVVRKMATILCRLIMLTVDSIIRLTSA